MVHEYVALLLSAIVKFCFSQVIDLFSRTRKSERMGMMAFVSTFCGLACFLILLTNPLNLSDLTGSNMIIMLLSFINYSFVLSAGSFNSSGLLLGVCIPLSIVNYVIMLFVALGEILLVKTVASIFVLVLILFFGMTVSIPTFFSQFLVCLVYHGRVWHIARGELVYEYGVSEPLAISFIRRWGADRIPHDQLVHARRNANGSKLVFKKAREQILAPWFDERGEGIV